MPALRFGRENFLFGREKILYRLLSCPKRMVCDGKKRTVFRLLLEKFQGI